jgi:hypothetical protein
MIESAAVEVVCCCRAAFVCTMFITNRIDIFGIPYSLRVPHAFPPVTSDDYHWDARRFSYHREKRLITILC